jgi:hypothetical protein
MYREPVWSSSPWQACLSCLPWLQRAQAHGRLYWPGEISLPQAGSSQLAGQRPALLQSLRPWQQPELDSWPALWTRSQRPGVPLAEESAWRQPQRMILLQVLRIRVCRISWCHQPCSASCSIYSQYRAQLSSIGSLTALVRRSFPPFERFQTCPHAKTRIPGPDGRNWHHRESGGSARHASL